ncbi:MAG TPA: immunoglobulin domain-containing protein [Verrucomicrobiae bacterium]|nr:immunoglobulin domain-containing protein [Verrucomicrobiae bacterium]
MANKLYRSITVFSTALLILLTSSARCYSQWAYPYVPIFQYEVFYNLNLEVNSASVLEFNAPVFCNASIWAGSPNVTFLSPVEAVGTVTASDSDPFTDYDSAGASTFRPGTGPFAGVIPVTFPAGGVSITNAEAVLQWPPPTCALGSSAAYTPEGANYVANFADLIISNSVSGTNGTGGVSKGTNFFVYYQDVMQPRNSNSKNWSSSIIWVTNDYYIVSNVTMHVLIAATNYVPASSWTSSGNTYQVWYAGYSFLTNVLFYDWREGWNGGNGYAGKGKSVRAVQFDISKFGIWQTNTAVNGGGYLNSLCNSDKNHPIGTVYIWNGVPLSTTQLPAVRIIHGSQLPDSYGLSVATPMPLYVLGDFNVTDGSGESDSGTMSTAHSRPASLLADAITVLSSSWNDSVVAKLPASGPETTIHAACFEGTVPSDPNLPSGADNSNYSGGVENFLRLLQSWGNLYYSGSIAVMFPSQYATNRWRQTGNYYDAPIREWSFDTNFVSLSKLPPCTPLVMNSNTAPSLTAQPSNEAVLAGQMTNFAASASGVPSVSYQWIFDGTNIIGATNDVLSLADINLTDGGYYAVQVSNVLGTVMSSNVLLSVYTSAAPVLSVFSHSPGQGGFSVSGVPGFTYTVETSTNLIDWTPLMTNHSPFICTDTNANLAQRFFRGFYVP